MKLACLFLCLLMLCGSAQAAVSVRMQDTAALLHENGEEIVPPGEYGDIVSIGGGFFAAGGPEGYALMDSRGKKLTEAIYNTLRFEAGAVLAQADAMYGLLDTEGNEIAKLEFSSILPADKNAFWALKDDPNDMESDEVFILYADGNEKATGLFVRGIAAASNGLAAVLLPENNMWGYCDASGHMQIPAAYSHAGTFISGRAAVVQNGKYGAIDDKGNFVAAPEFDFLEVSESGFMLAMQNGRGAYLLDINGREIAFHEGEETYAMLLGSGYGIVNEGELHIYNAQNALLETLDWDANVYEGLNGQLIVAEGAWGEECVYLLGTSARYQNLYPLGMDGEETLYACMQVQAARYVSDLLGEILYAVDMEMARYGVVNARGELLLPCEYEAIEYLGGGRLQLYADGLWQMSTAEGEILWQYGTKQTEEPSSEADF